MTKLLTFSLAVTLAALASCKNESTETEVSSVNNVKEQIFGEYYGDRLGIPKKRLEFILKDDSTFECSVYRVSYEISEFGERVDNSKWTPYYSGKFRVFKDYTSKDSSDFIMELKNNTDSTEIERFRMRLPCGGDTLLPCKFFDAFDSFEKSIII